MHDLQGNPRQFEGCRLVGLARVVQERTDIERVGGLVYGLERLQFLQTLRECCTDGIKARRGGQPINQSVDVFQAGWLDDIRVAVALARPENIEGDFVAWLIVMGGIGTQTGLNQGYVASMTQIHNDG